MLVILAWIIPIACADEREVVTKDIPRLEIRATVGPSQTANAIAPVEGRIATVRVSEGATIRQGTTIATIANAAIDRDIAYAKAQVAVAEQRLRQAKPAVPRKILDPAGGSARERAAAQIAKNREAKRNRYRELFATHDVSRQELEDAENEYAMALRDWLAEREIASQKVIETDTSILRLELERAKAELAFADERRALLEVRAPISGVVTRVAARPGETIFPRDPIVEIANTATVEVRGTMAPELQRYVHRGMPVEVKVLTVPPRRYDVRIKTVLPGMVIVELPNPEGALTAGQTAVIGVK